jgi:cell wall-associated NlpC family hydrolase
MQRIRLAVLAGAAACVLSLAGTAGTARAAGPVWVVVSGSAPPADTTTFSAAATSVADVGLAQQIDAFLTTQGSPMAGAGTSFVSAGREVGLDPRYLVALTGAESSFGLNLFRPFNPFGWGYASFDSWDQAIHTVATGLQVGYLAEGRTDVYSIAAKYSPVGASNDPNGTNGQEPVNVARFLTELGGSPNDVRLGSGNPLAPAATPAAFGAGIQTVWGNSLGAQAASIALRYVGIPYVWGGDSPSGFDCSGLAMYAYGRVGLTLPHWTGYQWTVGRVVSPGELAPGDLLFFDMRGGVPQHEGMYVGNGLMVQAPHTGDIVRVVPLADGYLQRFVRAVRPY